MMTRFPPLLALLFAVYANSTSAMQIINNGDFETGDLTGWTEVSDLGQSGNPFECEDDWAAAAADIVCNLSPPTVLNGPPQGVFAAYNSFDAEGPLSFIIEQDIALGSEALSTAELSFQYSIGWDFSQGRPGLAERIFSLSFLDTAEALLGEAFAINVDTRGDSAERIDWTAETVDVLGILAGQEGQTVTLVAEVFVPEAFTGPATLGLDALALNIESGSPVPAPSTLILCALALVMIRRRRLA